MKYFFSSSARAYDMLKELGATNFLLSFAVDAKEAPKMISDYNEIIIDSGAFSVWNKGGSIDIDEYLEFCKSLPEEWTYINLDVIPETGSSQEDIDKCCEQGYENYLYLKQHLKNVMPVYHYGDNIKWLHKFVETSDYIGISPANDTHEYVKRKFLCEVFDVLKDNVKTHALGYSSFDGLKMFPFYSVDSISFKKSKINGTQFWNEDSKLWFYLRKRIKEFLKIQRDITEIWEYRGTTWNK
ncbi:putative queuosine tRNA-ribosyltransferase [Cellulophaga phage phi47:1]|uniref:queuine tRNA-ribosyltransferase n=1 Tax=Cellulophaga phage phiSM TaxID=756280 RepID=UPI0002B7943B|nr:queuine tRNA-ribosyltransferase [Cellulophaga phage phiSM]AGF91618.1 hypothetical protein CDPG_00014 [Cellulophaga phage phi47:1]AGO47783.1 putative queuosine tRNA-ribosyltransferase [Cellulophaga phage phi3ST:2]AGO49291.1 putative queuosine tRNA-ribosyltransferase [Cellulophaga phage phi38:2]AGO49371.1 putative queuosine tRNA-ribosyltransferase [Cellulophaga phage phi3:1]AGH07801.1 hypothetical protein CEPG_00053 [Cellulophaga phage phiSM]